MMLESRWSKVTAGVMAGVAVLAAVWFSVRGAGNQVNSVALVRWVACSGCGHSYRGESAASPDLCPKCGKKTIWPAMRCSKCGKTVAIDTFKFDAERREPHCPTCKGARLQAIPD